MHPSGLNRVSLIPGKTKLGSIIGWSEGAGESGKACFLFTNSERPRGCRCLFAKRVLPVLYIPGQHSSLRRLHQLILRERSHHTGYLSTAQVVFDPEGNMEKDAQLPPPYPGPPLGVYQAQPGKCGRPSSLFICLFTQLLFSLHL